MSDGADRALPGAERDRSRRQCRAAGRGGRARPRRAARRCCSRPKCRACSTATASARWPRRAPRTRTTVLAAVRDAAARGGDLGPSRLARAARRGRQARQSRLRDRRARARSARAMTRSICSTSTLPTGESWRESAMYAAGERRWWCADTPVGTLGLTICYDLRFPALFAAAEPRRGPTSSRCRRRSPCRPARRIGRCCCARGRSRPRRSSSPRRRPGGTRTGATTYGHSLVADPWGEVLLEMGDEPGLAFAEIDLGADRRGARAHPGAGASPRDRAN